MLLHLLRGKTPEAQRELEKVREGIDEERVLWYPSAGGDYRDVLEMTAARRSLHGIDTAPNVIVHTDYDARASHLDRQIIHEDPRTVVELEACFPLALAPAIEARYHVDARFAVFPDHAPSASTVHLAHLKFTSKALGVVRGSVFFFAWENYNFLADVLLAHRVRVSHLVKVCEGCGFGGCRTSISCVYAWLGSLGTEYLLVDDEIHFCRVTHDGLAARFGPNQENYTLEPLALIGRWSGFRVRAFRVAPDEGHLTLSGLENRLAAISRRWHYQDLPRHWRSARDHRLHGAAGTWFPGWLPAVRSYPDEVEICFHQGCSRKPSESLHRETKADGRFAE